MPGLDAFIVSISLALFDASFTLAENHVNHLLTGSEIQLEPTRKDMKMRTPLLTIGALAIAIASGLSVSAASPVPTQAFFDPAPASIATAPATAHKTQVEGRYLLAEEDDKDCPGEEIEIDGRCINLCRGGLC